MEKISIQPLEKLERKVQKGSNKLKTKQNQKTKSRNTLMHQGEAATSSGIVPITFTESARRALCEQFMTFLQIALKDQVHSEKASRLKLKALLHPPSCFPQGLCVSRVELPFL